VPGADTIVLNNGGLVKGTLVELLPDHVTVQLANGQTAVIAAKDVHHIERQAAKPGTPAPTPPPPPAPSSAPDPSNAVGGPRAFVHVDSPRAVYLMMRNPASGAWEFLCDMPCDRMVPLEGAYRLYGSGLQPTGEFQLQGNPGDRVVVHMVPSARGTMVAGWVLVGTGGGVVVIGLLTMAVGALMNSTNSYTLNASGGSVSTAKNGDTVVAVGGVMALVGVAGIAAGLALALPNLHSSAEQEVAGRAQAKDDAKTENANAAGDRWLRVPEWRDTAHATTLPSVEPRAITVPILSGTF
jgi:hypothetical protein